MSIVQRLIVEPPETRMVLENVAWETYVALADQRRGSVPRMTYDNGESLKMYRLENEAYALIDSSVELPGLSTERINQHLASRDSIGETKLMQRFREAVSRPDDTATPERPG